MLVSPQRRAHLAPRTFVSTFATASRIEGGPLSKCGCRLSAAHIRLNNQQELHGLRAVRYVSKWCPSH
eukprot:5742604-Pyramimonas_sp.AAC.1